MQRPRTIEFCFFLLSVAKWEKVGYCGDNWKWQPRIQPVLFTGEIDRSIDNKLRMSIPSEMRPGFVEGPGPNIVYASPGPIASIWIWPAKTFETMANSLEQSLLPDEDVMDFEQVFFSLSRRIEIDKVGRIRLPDSLLSLAKITDHIAILGVKDHLELMDATRWADLRKQKVSGFRDIITKAIQQGIVASRKTTE
jgi:MraZ protein